MAAQAAASYEEAVLQQRALQAENERRLAEARQRHAQLCEQQALEAAQALAAARQQHVELCEQLGRERVAAEEARQGELERLAAQVGRSAVLQAAAGCIWMGGCPAMGSIICAHWCNAQSSHQQCAAAGCQLA